MQEELCILIQEEIEITAGGRGSGGWTMQIKTVLCCQFLLRAGNFEVRSNEYSLDFKRAESWTVIPGSEILLTHRLKKMFQLGKSKQ